MLRYEESIHIAPPAEVVYDLVADVTSTGDRSPECRHVEWLDEPARAVAGAPFRGHLSTCRTGTCSTGAKPFSNPSQQPLNGELAAQSRFARG